MLKRNKTTILCLLLFSNSCGNKQQEVKIEKNKIETLSLQYHADDVVGVWNVFHIEITQGRYNESVKNPILYKANYINDSLVIKFKKDFTLSVNEQIIGNWNINNDSVEIINCNNITFPLNINTKYKIHKGNFGKNWYLYTSYYNVRGEISHSVRVVAKRGIPK